MMYIALKIFLLEYLYEIYILKYEKEITFKKI